MPHAGELWAFAASAQDCRAIAKKQIAVYSGSELAFHTTNHDAYIRVQSQQAIRISDKAIQLLPAKSNYGKCSWAVRQSGYAGPLVMQVIT